jgi:hypothetical protein
VQRRLPDDHADLFDTAWKSINITLDEARSKIRATLDDLSRRLR